MPAGFIRSSCVRPSKQGATTTMNTLLRLLTTATLALACQGLSAAEVRTAPNVTKAGYREGPPAGKQWKMVWNDEFDGTAVDTNKWLTSRQR